MTYNSQKERLVARAKSLKRAGKKRRKRVSGRYWRLVIPALDEYGCRPARNHEGLKTLKQTTLDLLFERETSRGLDSWSVTWQTHPGSGLAHLDILLVYSKTIKNLASRYDYLVKHGHLTKYRGLSQAVIDYNLKQDMSPLTNINVKRLVMEARVKGGLYEMFESAMLGDPFKFNCHEWLDVHDLYRAAFKTNLYKAIKTVKDRQQVVCNRLLQGKPGICVITRKFIVKSLPPEELSVYDSWAGYQTIIDRINQIPRWGCKRPHKSANLLVVGRPNTGKTTLALQIEKHCPTYYKGVTKWFPSYRSGVYTMTLWNEFTLGNIVLSDTLNFLQGTTMDLQYKGGTTVKTDNPLVYMTSNWSLQQHICKRFKSRGDRQHARMNLKARIQQVIIPKDMTLFLLLKLIRSA